jgi:hypothetical protein
MITIYVEDRDIRDSLPNMLAQLYKHVLNCIYEPKLFHRGWTESIYKQITAIQKEVKRSGYKKVYNILEDNVNESYRKGVKDFYVAFKSSSKGPYTLSYLESVLPNSYKDIGKDTIYSKFKWDVETILNMTNIEEFITLVKNNSESNYDLYKG